MTELAPPDTAEIDAFIARWERYAGGEMKHSQSFLNDLCLLIRVPRPHDDEPGFTVDDYDFEHASGAVGTGTSDRGRIDLYRRGRFILESKQGSWPAPGRVVDESTLPKVPERVAAKSKGASKGHGTRGTGSWQTAMHEARAQARNYAQSLPENEPHVPFLLIVDVGYCIDVLANFSTHARHWTPYPSSGEERIYLRDLHNPAIIERLRAIWLDPDQLNPSRRRIAVTRELAASLSIIATELEQAGHDSRLVAEFLTRCLFAMFAEDVGLLPENGFLRQLQDARDVPERMRASLLEAVFAELDRGGWSSNFKREIRRFNGRLFSDSRAFALSDDQLELLIAAARMDWADVEPAIFGTLLERALNPAERHKLGAHYTPASYVERLVDHTIIDVLRAQWEPVLTAAITNVERGQIDAAARRIRAFHKELCGIRILDPACGSGNFLYVTLARLKDLEAEVLTELARLTGETQEGLELADIRVSPAQFLGIEKSQRAATTADLVLWIGYLQWQIRNAGVGGVPEPVLQVFNNIECRDAVMLWDSEEIRRNSTGDVVMRWGGRKVVDPSTGAEVPNPADTVPVTDLVNPRRSPWPKADFIVGNPPFLGNWKMRQELGDGYTEALRALYGDVPESVDFVMYWWERAAELLANGQVRRFGFITTNSITQVFARKVMQRYMNGSAGGSPVRLAYAVPDHPWVDAALGADVRIAITVADAGNDPGVLERVIEEHPLESGEHTVMLESIHGVIAPDLKVGVDLTMAQALRANHGVCSPGVKLHGAGFIVTRDKAAELGLGSVDGLEQYIVEYRNGRDITQHSRDVMVIDLFGLTAEEVRRRFPAVYQHVVTHVKPERDKNNRATYRDNWWIFGEPRKDLRPVLAELPRYIATVETSRERFFVLLDEAIRPDNKLVNIGLAESWQFGVLCAKHHVLWALRTGGRLGVGNDPVYVKSTCFDAFPFPEPTPTQQERIGALAEEIDALRKARQAEHPKLPLNKMYSVMEKLRAGEPLDAKEQRVRDQGTVVTLLELHTELDAAVAAAYGWPADLTDDDILARLLALNHQRAAEEAAGHIKWLRPDYQIPRFGSEAEQSELRLLTERPAPTATSSPAPTPSTVPTTTRRSRPKAAPVTTYTPLKQPWPTGLTAQLKAVRDALGRLGSGASAEDVAACFVDAPVGVVRDLVEGLG